MNTLFEVKTNLILEDAEQWQINTIDIQIGYIKGCIKGDNKMKCSFKYSTKKYTLGTIIQTVIEVKEDIEKHYGFKIRFVKIKMTKHYIIVYYEV